MGIEVMPHIDDCVPKGDWWLAPGIVGFFLGCFWSIIAVLPWFNFCEVFTREWRSYRRHMKRVNLKYRMAAEHLDEYAPLWVQEG